jgi:hypothetical protein
VLRHNRAGIMSKKSCFIFLCDQATESECLTKNLMGVTQANALWAMSIKPGDNLYLFNFNTRIIRGPYAAISTADCYDTSAWQGKFPVQVRVTRTALTKMADSRSTSAPDILTKRLPPHVLGTAADELFSWIQASGKSVEEAPAE